jgi:hypothetical protein
VNDMEQYVDESVVRDIKQINLEDTAWTRIESKARQNRLRER